MSRLQDKIAVVTGGAVGIGRACCLRMAEQGAAIGVLDLLETEGHALVAELRALGARASFHKVDVTREAEVKAAIDAVAAEFGGLTTVVANAGISGNPNPTDQITEADWDLVQAVNVKGVMFTTKHAIPHLRAAGGGAIINLSSIAGLVAAGGLPAYHASKGAVRLLTKADAITYAPERIRVNSIHPAYILTPMVEAVFAAAPDPTAARAAAAAAHPVGHMGEPDDIAFAVVYLACDEAKFVTGAELVVDGGYTAR